MYGDNRGIIYGGAGLVLILLLASLSLVSLVKINRLEKSLTPEKALPVREQTGDKENVSTDEDLNAPFYRALDLWEEKNAEETLLKEKTAALKEQDWGFLRELNLTMEESATLYTRTLSRGTGEEKRVLFYLEWTGEEWMITAPSGKSFSFTKRDRKTEAFLREQTNLWEKEQEERTAWIALFEETAADGETARLLALKECRLNEIRGDEGITGLTVITRSEDRPVMTLTLEGAVPILDGVAYEGGPDRFAADFRDRLSRADTRREEEIRLSRGLDRINSLYRDKDFLAYMKKKGLTPGAGQREDNDFVYRDLVDEEGILRASFAVKKYSGEIHIMDGRDIPLAGLDSLTGGTLSSGWDDSGTALPANGMNILLVGYHNRGTDTMILAHVDRSRETISLISIPRDLWWEGRKLNAYFFGSGKEQLLDILSGICGMKVDYYLSVDMYAFIDVVNALGGIDVTLEEEVRDPTYRVVRENGSEGTLYYPPGTYHLDGVEALRLARSRHGSSDFERGLLQQKILGALRVRAGELTAADLGTYGRFLKIASEQTDSNMSFPVMVKTLSALNRYTLESGYNLNDETLLYTTYSGYLSLSPEELDRAKANENFNRGQWILLPRDNDWDLIKERIRQITEG